MKWGAQQGWQTGFENKPTGTIFGTGWRYFRVSLIYLAILDKI